MNYTTTLQIADSPAEVTYCLNDKGKVVILRIINLEHGNPVTATTMAGSAFEDLAAGCAQVIEAQRERDSTDVA